LVKEEILLERHHYDVDGASSIDMSDSTEQIKKCSNFTALGVLPDTNDESEVETDDVSSNEHKRSQGRNESKWVKKQDHETSDYSDDVSTRSEEKRLSGTNGSYEGSTRSEGKRSNDKKENKWMNEQDLGLGDEYDNVSSNSASLTEAKKGIFAGFDPAVQPNGSLLAEQLWEQKVQRGKGQAGAGASCDFQCFNQENTTSDVPKSKPPNPSKSCGVYNHRRFSTSLTLESIDPALQQSAKISEQQNEIPPESKIMTSEDTRRSKSRTRRKREKNQGYGSGDADSDDLSFNSSKRSCHNASRKICSKEGCDRVLNSSHPNVKRCPDHRTVCLRKGCTKVHQSHCNGYCKEHKTLGSSRESLDQEKVDLKRIRLNCTEPMKTCSKCDEWEVESDDVSSNDEMRFKSGRNKSKGFEMEDLEMCHDSDDVSTCIEYIEEMKSHCRNERKRVRKQDLDSSDDSDEDYYSSVEKNKSPLDILTLPSNRSSRGRNGSMEQNCELRKTPKKSGDKQPLTSSTVSSTEGSNALEGEQISQFHPFLL
jgi:hypothetical protein